MHAGHDDDVAGSNRFRLGIALAITACVLAAEVVGAWLTGRLALLVEVSRRLRASRRVDEGIQPGRERGVGGRVAVDGQGSAGVGRDVPLAGGGRSSRERLGGDRLGGQRGLEGYESGVLIAGDRVLTLTGRI